MSPQTRDLPAPIKTEGNQSFYPAIWVTVGRISKFGDKSPDEPSVDLGVKGERDTYWIFSKRDAHMAVDGAQLQVEGDDFMEEPGKALQVRGSSPRSVGRAGRE